MSYWNDIKSFFCNHYTIFHPKEKRDIQSDEWYMLLAFFMVIWLFMLMRYWNG